MSDHLGGMSFRARGTYVPVGTPEERAVARDFLLEYGRQEDIRCLLPRLEAWDWPGWPPAWLWVYATGAYFVW